VCRMQRYNAKPKMEWVFEMPSNAARGQDRIINSPEKLISLKLFHIFGLKLQVMETLRIEIINPKAKRLLKDLADLNLITINKSVNDTMEFKAVLSKLRSNAKTRPSLDEITREVEDVRAARYAKKAK
jgi:hypothetical protein